MPPKRGASSGPARGTSKGPGGKAKSKAKAAAVPPVPADPLAELEKEAEELFEHRQPDGDLRGVLKLAQIADIVRDMNRRKCMLWGDDPALVIKREWSKLGGATSREVTLVQFKSWWPEFVQAANSEVEEKALAEEAKAAEAKKAQEEKYSGDGVWQISFGDLKEAVKEARKKGKTPLVIDNTEGHRVETFYMYSDAYIVECKKMIVEKATGTSVDAILEEERRRFFSGKCFKHGRTVMLRLANTACDLKGAFNSETFPVMALMDAGEVVKVLGLENADKAKESPFYKMAPDQDEAMTLEANGIHEDFNVVVVTHFAEEDYEGFLKDMVPLHLMQPMKPRVE